MYTTNSNFKKIMVTVNGEPVGNGLVLDSITFRPVNEQNDSFDTQQKTALKQ
ncbi:hypothetical protein [Saccharibacillus kuerlensis]|uniref:Uncharacterized protein n=1 Tax=Saccharibacillus kuerlensis TaxID=459527 RepID=A0ABQ2L164_9BACL|nr:hypothetical protein [Saccharibacillus kuerlensis]GGN98973.1 hypothetical protein GCM10010969_18720 [Saccharibacillus kuerlensis]